MSAGEKEINSVWVKSWGEGVGLGLALEGWLGLWKVTMWGMRRSSKSEGLVPDW